MSTLESVDKLPDGINGLNSEFLLGLYEQWKQDPESVNHQWQWFFRGFDLAAERPSPAQPQTASQPSIADGRGGAGVHPDLQISELVHSYRELGHLIANLDPLGHNQSEHPLLELGEFDLSDADLDRLVKADGLGGNTGMVPLRQLISMLRQTY